MTAQQFKEERMKRGYSRRQWAELLGISVEAVRSKETESRKRTVTKRDIVFIGMLPPIEKPIPTNEEHD